MRLHVLCAVILFAAGTSFPSKEVAADAPTCHTYSPGPYCTYHGHVQQAYVNESSWILVYFDTPLDLSAAAAVGLNVTNSGACIYRIPDNPDFAKLFYASVLSGQARDVPIAMQMRAGSDGYLKCDRIWVPR